MRPPPGCEWKIPSYKNTFKYEYECATCKVNKAHPDKVYYNIPFCSEECYDRHSPCCGESKEEHWKKF
jgi:hypothetical protein